MQARKTTHCVDGQHQYMDKTPCGRVDQNDKRTELNGESTSLVWPTLGSRMAEEQNRQNSTTISFSHFRDMLAAPKLFKKLHYHRGTVRCTMSVEILSTAAQL